MNVPTKTAMQLALCLYGTVFIAGCDSRASRAQKAFDQYQTASAAGNLIEMRNALLKLTAASEDNPAYWVELGKVQYQLRAVGPAFDAFSRANELNRSDPEVLRYLTQIALQAGNLELAEERANDLDLVSPGSPVVKITKGLIALRRQDYTQAQSLADSILAATPDSTDGVVLKSRALVGLGKTEEALTLLEKQVASKPSDGASRRALLSLRRRSAQWPMVMQLGQELLKLDPNDRATALLTIEAALLAREPAIARSISLDQLRPGASPSAISGVLDVWREFWSGPEPISLARELATKAQPAEQVAYARYLNRVGAAATAKSLLADRAGQVPKPDTIDALAVYADSLFRLGQIDEARRRVQDVLDEDPDNTDGLRTMAELMSKTGDKAGALNIARNLVAVDPATVESRFVLANIFDASGDRESARRALWDAFHEIPGSERVYRALRAYLVNDSDATTRLDEEFADQRNRKLMQDSQ